MEIIDKGIVFQGKKDSEYSSCAFPGVCVLPDGRWICSFRTAPSKSAALHQNVRITWSDNEGKSWATSISPFNPIFLNSKPGIFRCGYLTVLKDKRVMCILSWVDHSNPDLSFFNEETEGLLDTKIFLSFSENRGEKWSVPKAVDASPFNNFPTPVTGPLLILPDGYWACQFEINKPYYDKMPWRHSSIMTFSKNNGESWNEHTVVSNDPGNRIFYWDQRPGVLKDGRVLVLFWTYDTKCSEYLNIHARESLDCCRTWSNIWDTGVSGQPAPPVLLEDGRIAMVYVQRTDTTTIKMRISKDNGRIWPDDTEMVIYQTVPVSQVYNKMDMKDAWKEMSLFSVGLPATTFLRNGDILIVYYAGLHTDNTSIYWARVGDSRKIRH
ncbi:MAG: exo-alpha-sialidase [Candidatus Omnitrophica bacterium]|nr:exo-alpha-sialidase [Candidatus Omnitrophota bacterium]